MTNACLARRDGGGIVIRTRGEPLGQPVTPVAREFSAYEVIQHNSIVEPELKMIQSTYQSALPPSERSLPDFGISPITTPSRHTFSLVPHQVYVNQFNKNDSQPASNPSIWQFGTTYDLIGLDDLSQLKRQFHPAIASSTDKVAIAHQAQKVVLCDENGQCHIHRFGRFDEAPMVFDQLIETSQHFAIATDPDATTLFATTGRPGETNVAALDLNSGASLWKQPLDGMENGACLALLRDRLLVTSWFGWRLLDVRTGDTISDVSPRAEHGIRHGQVRKHPLDDTLLSWHRYGEIEPVVAWSSELELQWFAFATSEGQWLILSSQGKLLGEVTTNTPLVNRFVGKSPERYRPASWADGIEPMIFRPKDSLTLVQYHSDGRTTCKPFKSLDADDTE